MYSTYYGNRQDGYGYGYGNFRPYDPTLDPFAAAFFDPNVGLYEARTGSSATDAVVQRTDPVGTWRSVNGSINGTAASDAARPTWHPFGINSTPGVLFDGTQHRLSFVTDLADLFRNKQYVYVFFAVKPVSEAVAGTLFAWGNPASNSRFAVVMNSGGTAGLMQFAIRRLDADSATTRNVTSAFTNGEVCCFATEVGYADGDFNVWKGETMVLDSTIGGTPGASSDTASGSVWVGANNAGTAWYDGQLGHWLVCTPSRKLTTPEIMERQRWMMRQVAFSQVTPPAGLSFTPAIEVWTNGSTYRTTFDRSLHDVARAVTYYVDPDNGNDSNDGLTTGTALQTLTNIHTLVNAQTSAEVILTRAGTGYTGLSGAAITKPVTFRCNAGLAIISQGVGGSAFVADQGTTWVTSANHSATHVYDFANRNQYGAPQQLTQASSLSECRATPGTFVVASSKTYVNLSDGRQPDNSISTSTSALAQRLSVTGTQLFMENICTVGISASHLLVSHSGTTDICLIGCQFHHAKSSGGDVVALDMDGRAYLVNCLVTGAGADGIDYKDGPGEDHISYEIDTQSHQAGRTGATACNCTTAHGTAKAVRVNGRYFAPLHRAVHDVNETESWNINCQAEAGTATDSYPPGAWSVGLDEAFASEMYLDNCLAFGDADHFQVFGANSRLYYRNNMSLSGTQTGSDKMELY